MIHGVVEITSEVVQKIYGTFLYSGWRREKRFVDVTQRRLLNPYIYRVDRCKSKNNFVFNVAVL
jgi:hypothetical protein